MYFILSILPYCSNKNSEAYVPFFLYCLSLFGTMLLEKMKGLIDLSLTFTDNQSLIGTSEAAKILGVSESTVRRLADNGKLDCVVVSTSKYRKFHLDQVNKYKSKMFLVEEKMSGYNEPSYSQLDLFSNEPEKKIYMKNISAKSHPAHYLMHKYWGRKPHNVVSDYIINYSEPGDTVLDPFMGSGIVPIEAIKNNRSGIGIDINPMSKFIAENTVSTVDIQKYMEISKGIIQDVSTKCDYMYHTSCPICGDVANIEVAVWDNGLLKRIKGKCVTDGIFTKDADINDQLLYDKISKLKKQYDDEGTISYPKDKVLQYVKRSGKESIDELFTDRALIILSILRDSIREVSDENIKDLLMFTFTSMLANVSNMLPGDLEKATYKSGWVISKFWTPKTHTERNIFHCFNLRVKAIIKGKKELSYVDDSQIRLYTADSNHLEFLKSNSIDYIFTDPPYGESIAYLALSQFWNSWLDNTVDYKNEIIVDSYREKDYGDYSKRMLLAFQEMYRVLKNKRYLSFTFHNRDLSVWKGVMDAVKYSGFILKDITLQEQAVNSGTQGINKLNTLTGDFVYTLYKDDTIKPNHKHPKGSAQSRDYVKSVIKSLIEKNNGITPSKLYEELIPIIVHSEMYLDEKGRPLDIEKILKEQFDYVEVENENKIGAKYQWQIRK